VRDTSGNIIYKLASIGESVFNDTGSDVDFRVEGDMDASLFVADAGMRANGNVGVGTTAPASLLHVSGGGIAVTFGSRQTAGFQIPNIERNGVLETAGLDVGDPVIGRIDERMEDGALHGVWEKFDFATEIRGAFASNPDLLSDIGVVTRESITATELQHMTVEGTLTVIGSVTFFGNLDVQGFLFVGRDQAGEAVVPAGSSSIQVTFSQAWPLTPMVQLTPDYPVAAAATNRNQYGFTVQLASSAPQDVTVSWFAVTPKDGPRAAGSAALPPPPATEPESDTDAAPAEESSTDDAPEAEGDTDQGADDQDAAPEEPTDTDNSPQDTPSTEEATGDATADTSDTNTPEGGNPMLSAHKKKAVEDPTTLKQSGPSRHPLRDCALFAPACQRVLLAFVTVC
jgi:hypothetical protein